MSKIKVCLSFDYENDLNSRKAITLWNTNSNIDFSVNDVTPTEINSDDIGRIKAGLSAKINKSEILLVISGKYMNTRHRNSNSIGAINWQNWECKKALEYGKRIIVVKLNSLCEIPNELVGKTNMREVIIGLEKDKVNRAIELLLVH